MSDSPQVLFVCVHNAGRSQMAAALTAMRGEGSIDVLSAGTEPADQVNPAVLEAMAELGIDLSQEQPKLLQDQVVAASDVVISMGCGDACPVYPGIAYEDWQLDDPEGRDLEAVRLIRDEIDGRVTDLVERLLGQRVGRGETQD